MMADVEAIKQSADLLQIVQRTTSLKKVASTGSGEWAGACPFCGGDDRFRLQEQAPPGKKPAGERWMCRQCTPQWGDVIGFVMKRDGVDFRSAMKILDPEGAEMDDRKIKASAPRADEIDRPRWTMGALGFIEMTVNALWSDEGKGALAYLHSRGLDDETLQGFAIGYNPIEGLGKPAEWGIDPDVKIWLPRGIVIPCQDGSGLHYVKVRRRTGHPKYIMIKGSHQWLYGAPTYHDKLTAFLFEGEFDALLAWSTGLIGVGLGSLPAGQNLRAEYQPFFTTIEDLVVAYDNDEPGQEAAESMCLLSPHFLKAYPFPQGKDLTEYYQLTGSLQAVFDWLYAQLDLLK
jgi:DNA primase